MHWSHHGTSRKGLKKNREDVSFPSVIDGLWPISPMHFRNTASLPGLGLPVGSWRFFNLAVYSISINYASVNFVLPFMALNFGTGRLVRRLVSHLLGKWSSPMGLWHLITLQY